MTSTISTTDATSPMLTNDSVSELEVRVSRRQRVAVGIDAFDLVSIDGTTLPARTAGAHIDVHVPGGMIRQYSLCNDPAEADRYVIGVLDDPNSRGGSAAMHASVNEGQTLTISPPRNLFPLVDGVEHSLLLAGGVGVTPILAMAHTLSASAASFELHYSTRSPEHTAFAEHLAGERFSGRVHHHHDSAGGVLPLPALLADSSPGSHLYVCGPTGYMDWVLGTAREAGWPDERLHFEFFSASTEVVDAGSFDVKIASTGATIRVGSDQTVVAALAENGINIPISCEQGVCGTCITGVLDGLPDHQDLYLMPKERALNDRFLPCCSRSESGLLVLDL
ncbi:MAG: 2Fe-2S iron-sulfur cluster-binding protein [Ilumatobacter sp.]